MKQIIGKLPSKEEWDKFVNSPEGKKLAKEHVKVMNKQLLEGLK